MKGKLTEAVRLLEEASTSRHTREKPISRRLDILKDLANVYVRTGRLQLAEARYRVVLELQAKEIHPDDPRSLSTYVRLGTVLSK